jgi:bifunctional DNA-binding transcriptional regulator/antitoxin component of YhaV-PrlF toxin-antitoxin module
MATTHYVTVQARGTISLPADLRRRLHLDEPGVQLELVERDDSVLELRPTLPVAADQRWFWTERWQAMEHQVDEQYARGEGRMHESTEAFADFIDSPGE